MTRRSLPRAPHGVPAGRRGSWPPPPRPSPRPSQPGRQDPARPLTTSACTSPFHLSSKISLRQRFPLVCPRDRLAHEPIDRRLRPPRAHSTRWEFLHTRRQPDPIDRVIGGDSLETGRWHRGPTRWVTDYASAASDGRGVDRISMSSDRVAGPARADVTWTPTARPVSASTNDRGLGRSADSCRPTAAVKPTPATDPRRPRSIGTRRGPASQVPDRAPG
jgi:hypothetical protein